MACHPSQTSDLDRQDRDDSQSMASVISESQLQEKPAIEEEIPMDATEWRFFYFTGITKLPISEIHLKDGHMTGLLSTINLQSSISTGYAIEPQFLINHKGATPWLAMLASAHLNHSEELVKIAKGNSRIHYTGDLHSIFNNHVNWPADIIRKYDFTLGEYRIFIIPFLIHKSQTDYRGLSRSMHSPDNTMEIFNFQEFEDENPEKLLKDIAKLVQFIKTERPDVIAR